MPRKRPDEPPRAGAPAADGEGNPERAGGADREAELERVGPLALARHLKDDGRSLLLFSWVGEDREQPAERSR